MKLDSFKLLQYCTLLCVCAANGTLAAQTTAAFRTDFFDGIPQQITTIDNDGCLLSPDVTGYGFTQGDAWVAYFIDVEQNMVAASTSWYKTPGTSDDYMVLPTLPTVDPQGCVLRWRSRCSDKWLPNAYKVIATTTHIEGTPKAADFAQADVLFETKGESIDWTSHNIDLSRYAEKELTIAFVDCSTDCSLLFVDDITFGTPAQVGIEITTAPVVTLSQPVAVKGSLFTDFDKTLTGEVVLNYECAGQKGKLEMGNVTIEPNARVNFDFDSQSLSLDNKKPETLTIKAMLNGIEVSKTSIQISAHNNMEVCEELTGAWCAWCVVGISTFDRLTAKFPDSFLPIAIHNADIMDNQEIKPYHDWVYSYGHASGYPFAFNMRDKKLDSEDWNAFDEIVENVNKAQLTVALTTTAQKLSDNKFALTTTMQLAQDCNSDRFRPFYVLLEDDVFDSEFPDPYTQHNAYAGGGQGECGGFENLPSEIPNFHYNHVARATVGAIEGEEGCFPVHKRAGKEYSYDTEITIPETVLNVENCSVATLIIDSVTSKIAQACVTRLGSNSGIGTIHGQSSGQSVRWYNLSGTLIDPQQAPAGVYIRVDVNGSASKIMVK